MWRFVVRFFAVIGFLFIALAAAGAIAAWYFYVKSTPPPLPDRIILNLDLRQAPLDARPNGSGLQSLFGDQPVTLYELEQALDRAATDPRVVGLAATMDGDVFDLSVALEIVAAVDRFKESGKPTVAHADTFGFPGNANAAYLVASAFDRIILGPVGGLGLTGLASQPIFAGPALDRVGAFAQFVRTGPYKTFPEMLTGDSMTDEHREMLDSILESSFAVLTNTIADNRGLGARDVAALIESGPLSAEQAHSGGLVDTIGGAQAVEDRLEAWFGDTAEMMDLNDYLSLPMAYDGGGEPGSGEPDRSPDRNWDEDSISDSDADSRRSSGARVALIHAQGMIVAHDSEGGAPGGGMFGTISAAEIAETISDIVEDGSFDGLILRLDTGGGSAVGSEVIAEALSRARLAGLATVVSMGSAAASGGYWVAVHADRIVATPATLTGSIGVFSGKISLGELGESLGISVETVERGQNAAMWSLATPFTPEQESRLQTMVDDLHDAFIDRVAEGRNMPRPRVVDLAGGRVWTGLQAADLGLVDSLGGLDQASAEMRDLLSIAADAPLTIVFAPEEPDFFENIMSTIQGILPFGSGSHHAHNSALSLLSSAPGPLRDLAPLLPMITRPDSMTLHMPFAPAP